MLWPTRVLVSWVATHIFRHEAALVIRGSGSGDKAYDWVEVFCFVVAAVLGTIIWSFLDRKRGDYAAVQKWFYLLVRFAVGSTMLTYGFVKAIPLQMPYPYLWKLTEPFGNFSPMGVLWSSIGASPAYEIFTGCAEILGGLLVLAPRTAVLGALICLADATNVFLLNMTYDVPVKLLSFHLVLLSLFLLAPHKMRLITFFFRNQHVDPPSDARLFQSPGKNRIAFIVQMVFITYLVATNAYGGVSAWNRYGGGAPKSELYGIWEVDQFMFDGQRRAALLTDTSRVRRVIFQFPNRVTFQNMDDSFVSYDTTLSGEDNSLTITESSNKKLKGNFKFQRPAPDQLVLDGTLDYHQAHLKLHLLDVHKFLLVSRGFHWIQEYPFNR